MRYVVIGGIAAVLHGVPRATFDLDILIEATPGNAARLLAAFLEAGLGTALLTTPEGLLQHEITVFNDRVRVDVQIRTPGLQFEEAWARRETMSYRGVPIEVVSRQDLLASKRAAAREKEQTSGRSRNSRKRSTAVVVAEDELGLEPGLRHGRRPQRILGPCARSRTMGTGATP